MPSDVLQALHAARSAAPPAVQPAGLLIAGATGVLGNEVLRRFVGLQRYGAARVLVREPLQSGLRGVQTLAVPGCDIAAWPPQPAETGLILFEPPRLFYDRERALWTPRPEDLLPVARWMRRSGVQRLAVVQPHVQGRLPEALKRGLASLDEQAVAALGFECLLLVRSAQKPAALRQASWPERVAAWMLSIGRFMVPSSEQPVRAAKVAELVESALQAAPPGIHVAAPELVWRAAQGDVRTVVGQWLGAPSPGAVVT